MRSDEPNENPEIRRIILENAPAVEKDYFVVPAVIE